MAAAPLPILAFKRKTLGLHLICKTVNLHALDTYHFYFTEALRTAGTDKPFFTFPNQEMRKMRTNKLSRASFRVPRAAALDTW